MLLKSCATRLPIARPIPFSGSGELDFQVETVGNVLAVAVDHLAGQDGEK